MLEFLFGSRRDKVRADRIINYLKVAFGVPEGSWCGGRHQTQLKLTSAVVDVEITCCNNKIRIALLGHSDSEYVDYHVPAQIERVRTEICNYLDGSHAAKWRHRVVIA